MKRLVVLFVLQVAIAMLIPEDAEILDGFGLISFPESSLDDDYFEARSLSAGPLFNSVRNKRALDYDVKESNGLISHFRPNTVNGYAKKVTMNEPELAHRTERSFRKFKKWLKKKFPESEEFNDERGMSLNLGLGSRKRRNVETEKMNKITLPKELVEKTNLDSERLPRAMKLTKSSDGITSMNRDSPTAAALVGKFARSPFEYSKIQHEEDSMAMDTSSLSVNEGLKSRTPRVNFVTQQKNDDTKTSASKSDFYKTPPLLHNSKESAAASENERYPEGSSTSRPGYKNRDVNNKHYDELVFFFWFSHRNNVHKFFLMFLTFFSRYIEDMYPPPPQPPTDMYDPIPIDYNTPYANIYMRRYPYSGYSGHYSDSRYDIPRDFPPMYENEIDSRFYMRSDMMPTPSSTLPRKRTIYYAYLPEVVRNPPMYRSYDRYDSYYPDYYDNYDANMVGNTYRRPVEKAFKYEYRTSRPMKSGDNDEMIRNSSLLKEKRFNHDDNKFSMNTYLHRRPSGYDTFY